MAAARALWRNALPVFAGDNAGLSSAHLHACPIVRSDPGHYASKQALQWRHRRRRARAGRVGAPAEASDWLSRCLPPPADTTCNVHDVDAQIRADAPPPPPYSQVHREQPVCLSVCECVCCVSVCVSVTQRHTKEDAGKHFVYNVRGLTCRANRWR